MKKPTTRKNLIADITSRLDTRNQFGMPGTYSVATSIAVMIASAIATLMYVRTVACPPPSGVAATACCSPMRRLPGDAPDDGEDGDPPDVGEVPVQARALDLGVVALVEQSAPG